MKVIQPDSADNVLLVEADQAGKTTLTVYDKGQIYRYFISTFENRGADVLEIENAFAAKGYKSLTISFDKDQAILGGSVPTQEELDDAVRIVKQYTQFVQVKATLGQDVEQSEYSEQEAIIVNNIQRIANVPGLTVRVKFPAPTVVTTSTYTKSTGDYVAPQVTTTPQGGTVRGSGFQPPAQDPNSLAGSGPLEPKPQQNTTETVTTTENTTVPEKIFLYGDIADDLQQARVLRVARTFCPFVVDFMTIRDPIQLRTEIRFMQVNHTKTRDTGVFWSGNGPEGGPTVTLGFGNSMFNEIADAGPDEPLHRPGGGQRRGKRLGPARTLREPQPGQAHAQDRALPDQRAGGLVLGGRGALLRLLLEHLHHRAAGADADAVGGLPGREHGHRAAQPGEGRRHGAFGPEDFRHPEQHRVRHGQLGLHAGAEHRQLGRLGQPPDPGHPAGRHERRALHRRLDQVRG